MPALSDSVAATAPDQDTRQSVGQIIINGPITVHIREDADPRIIPMLQAILDGQQADAARDAKTIEGLRERLDEVESNHEECERRADGLERRLRALERR